MSELSDYSKLYKLAEELVQGSRKAILSAQQATRKTFNQAYGRPPDISESRLVNALFPYVESSRFDIGPYGVQVQINDSGDRKIYSHGEFVGGIAVACGIDPSPKDVEAVIFHIGGLMRELET